MKFDDSCYALNPLPDRLQFSKLPNGEVSRVTKVISHKKLITSKLADNKLSRIAYDVAGG